MEKPAKAVRRKGRAVTIDEVALQAGVSPMTVSRVINGQGQVRDSTRERVMRTVHELGYRPNLAASTLAAAQHTCIALIYTNPSSSYLRELLVGALSGSARAAAQLVIASWDALDADAQRNAARQLAGNVAGVILPPPLSESEAIVSEFVNAGIPVVSIASGRLGDDISCVRIDDVLASREITEHLIRHGHRRIGYIKGDPHHTDSEHRFTGFKTALRDAGIVLDDALVAQGYYTYRSGLDAAEQLLSLDEPPTAIFASNDDMAAAVVSVAHRRGIDVPGGLSVVGFDDTFAATMVWPELTTVRQPIAQMADTAIDILLRALRRRDDSARTVINHVVPHQLIARDSVAPLDAATSARPHRDAESPEGPRPPHG
ncbi:LacI family DNA-binding transcriptional regulator [Lysobacter sp. LF1]|uniref:LacI family DNA-binding transcriptional regulator n=1 Tax=Lysobacter stagni TaxID=3045172 RepID=A0ABT6XJ83_9GAMM|nr:LacI family DNA-binding transcriptional regulator [Lysobacter sp. LF1]MDI9240091.1 LacI family DNA-binding transcriptional regulator [Lysobacter sp. LF1]